MVYLILNNLLPSYLRCWIGSSSKKHNFLRMNIPKMQKYHITSGSESSMCADNQHLRERLISNSLK